MPVLLCTIVVPQRSESPECKSRRQSFDSHGIARPFFTASDGRDTPSERDTVDGLTCFVAKGIECSLGAIDPCDRAGAERAVVFRGVRTVQKLNSVAQPPQTGLPATLHARRDAPFARLRRGDCGGADRRRCALGERPCGRCIRTRVRSQRGAGTHGPPASRSSMVLGAGNWD